jgi:hypothetical protein
MTGIALLLLSGGTAWACNVPVFRWALERWGAEEADDCYRLVVFHEGLLGPDEKSVVEWLQASAWPEKTVLNLTLETVNLSGEVKEPLREIWKAQPKPTIPWCVLRYPKRSRIEKDAWAGPFRREALLRLVDSPLRREIAKQILGGDVAVWILLESGNREKDEAASKALAGNLEKLEKVLKIPSPSMELMDWESGQEDPGARTEPKAPELKVSFKAVRLSRDDPAEEALHRMLIRSEKDLEEEYGSEPMAFPVFGRGRVPWALVGKGITEENIEETCQYLVGMCSCEVKQQNPGTDILFWTDWDAHFTGRQMLSDPLPQLMLAAAQAPVPEDTPVAEVARAAGEGTVASEALRGSAPEESGKAALRRNTLIALGVLAAGVAVSVLVLGRRSSRR